VIPYRPITGKYGLENHYGVMNEWVEQNVPRYTIFVNVSPTVALIVDNHKLTKEIFREWSRENYGRPVGAKIEWTKMSPQQIQKLSEDMFNASKTPDSARREYYRTFN